MLIIRDKKGYEEVRHIGEIVMTHVDAVKYVKADDDELAWCLRITNR